MMIRSPRAARNSLRDRLRYSLLLALAFLTLSTSASAGDGVSWRTDLASAQAEARARNLPLWVQFTGPWCLYCKRMDFETFPNAVVSGRANASFVPVKLRSDSYEEMVAQFGITSLPASVVLSPSNTLILARHQGFLDPGRMAGLLDGAWANHLSDPSVLALSGYCPVKLVQGEGRVEGNPALAVFHDGRAYRFADEKARTSFLSDPEKFLPSDGGRCVVSRTDQKQPKPGDPRFGVYYHNRLYLLADDDSRKKFAANPDKYAAVDLADNGECPLCRRLNNKTVVGKPEFVATHAGRRYLFSDETHRQAFRASPERYLK